MKTLLVLFGLVLVASVAYAGDDNAAPVPVVTRDACTLTFTSYFWDFNVNAQGFTPAACDVSGTPVWAWGAEATIPGSPGNVWGTVLNGSYPSDSGDGLLSPPFMVTPNAYLLEVNHYVHFETNFDGCNVSVDGAVILPTTGYPATISTSTSFYAHCVDLEPGWTGNSSTGPSQDWVAQCFDLTAFMGQMIQVSFDMGTDSSVTYPGWYLAYVAVGSDAPVSVDEANWGGIKALYR